jgi:hypothetical protein
VCDDPSDAIIDFRDWSSSALFRSDGVFAALLAGEDRLPETDAFGLHAEGEIVTEGVGGAC